MTEYIIALADLLEAEGRLLRRTVMHTGAGLTVLAVGALLLFGGLGCCLWAAYQALALKLGTVIAALLIGVLMLLVAGLIIWTVIRLAR